MKNKKIVVAEDDRSTRECLIEFLERDYEVSSVVDGLEALNLINKNPPNLLITDFQMPQMNGLELINELGKENYNFPIILTSGMIKDSDKNQIKYNGKVEFLEKPFSYINGLIPLVERVLK